MTIPHYFQDHASFKGIMFRIRIQKRIFRKESVEYICVWVMKWVKNQQRPTIFSYESTFISYICICTPKVQHLLICRNRFFYVYHRPRKEFLLLFCLFFFFIVFPPPLRSAFTSKLQQLYKEGRPRKVRSGKEIVGRSETVCLRYQFLKKDPFHWKRTSFTIYWQFVETPCQSVEFLIRTVKLREFRCLCVH